MTYSDEVRAREAYRTQGYADSELDFSSDSAAFKAGYLAALAELQKASGVFSLASPPPGHSFDGMVSALIRGRDGAPVPPWAVAPAFPPPPAPSREQQIAMREGEHWGSSEPYFKARPELDDPKGRRVFEAGFTRGYDAAQGL